jgi:hypothetical protein
MNLFRVLAIVVAIALSGAACDRKPAKSTWMSREHHKWPQIALTNAATFKGHSALEGASCFLVKSDDGKVYGVTARHLVGPDGGVHPDIDLQKLDVVLASWRMSVRTEPDLYVEVNKVAARGSGSKEDDWLLLSLKMVKNQALPGLALPVRDGALEVGDTVYMLGCPYDESFCKQNVYKGEVTAVKGKQFSFSFSPAVHLRGFSGAPIIDKNGHAAGILLGVSKAAIRNEVHNEGVAQGMEPIRDWLESN